MSYTFRDFYIPERMMNGIEQWVLNGVKPGDFLYAVIINDLRTAVFTADLENLRNLPAFVAYFYNAAPIACWGSLEKATAWQARMQQARENDSPGSTT